LFRHEFAETTGPVEFTARVLPPSPCMRALGELVALVDTMIGPPLACATNIAIGSALFLVVAMPTRGCSKERAYTTAMRSDLRNMVTAQEAHFEKHARYASVLPPDEYRHSTGVASVSMDVGAMGFVAVMSYPAGTTKLCRIVYRRGQYADPTCDK